MIEAILTTLADDEQLTDFLSGGIYRVKEISRQETPGAYDADRELLPCALLRQESATPWGPHDHSGRLYVTVWFYSRSGYCQIDLAVRRVYELLHRQRVFDEGELDPISFSLFSFVHKNRQRAVEEEVALELDPISFALLSMVSIDQPPVIDDAGPFCYEIRHANDLLDMEDPTLGVPMAMSRYVVTVQRM